MVEHRVNYAARWLAAAALTMVAAMPATVEAGNASCVVIITVDALRADSLSCYGYKRPTSPSIDALLERGVRFTNARTIEPLTNPALTSMLTSLPPHEHGATRNGLRMKPGLRSLSKIVSSRDWYTAAFVANWTLKDDISRMGEHFEHYQEVFTRKRWFGMLNSEATAEDVTDSATEWMEDFRASNPDTPLLLWVHYVEPHAPYRWHKDFASRLGLSRSGASPRDRYDTEVAFVDHQIGRLLEAVEELLPGVHPLVVFAADHGESLGEHRYWGHGRRLYEPSLRIPMGVTWEGHLGAGTIEAPALIIDLAPTVLELVGIPVPETFRGHSWAEVLRGNAEPILRPVCYQAHKGAVQVRHESDRARRKGLLAVGVVMDGRKEILRFRGSQHVLYDLDDDPQELRNLASADSEPSPQLVSCIEEIELGLEASDVEPATPLDDEDLAMLEQLGYIE
jgi:arylsulfatase A-like enzyme